MSQPATHVLSTLKKRGYRLTDSRRAVVTTLMNSASPLSIQEVVSAVSVDEATVYRTIKLLNDENLIESISIPGTPDRFALSHEHHHHIVCTTCSKIEHIPCVEPPTPPTDVKNTFATVASHEVTYYGTCKRCAS